MTERVGDEKLIIISVAVRGINDHIRFYSQMLCTAAINTSNTTRTQTGAAERVSRYQKGKTNLGFTEVRDSEWQLHQLGHMQVCTSLQIDNHASTPTLRFLQAGCPSCRPTNSVEALKA